MISMIMTGERNKWFEGIVTVNGEAAFRRKVVADPADPWPYTVRGADNFLVRFLTYDGARLEVMKQVTNEFNRLHGKALAEANTENLQRFIDEISPPA